MTPENDEEDEIDWEAWAWQNDADEPDMFYQYLYDYLPDEEE